ncbi:MAG: ATP-binding cassette domain-containing protein, partial [Steroidobacteraceae bacterium]
MIKSEHLCKRYESLTAVDDVSFEVRPGEVLGFLGPNGAGKTTTMRMLAGFIAP